jgi:hypothetical protein
LEKFYLKTRKNGTVGCLLIGIDCVDRKGLRGCIFLFVLFERDGSIIWHIQLGYERVEGEEAKKDDCDGRSPVKLSKGC